MRRQVVNNVNTGINLCTVNNESKNDNLNRGTWSKWWYCSVQSCPFVQCCPGILLVQCRENLGNVGTTLVATGYYQEINWFKIRIAEKWCYSGDIALGCLWGNIAQGFYLCNINPRVLRHYWTEFFHVQCWLEPLGHIVQSL